MYSDAVVAISITVLVNSRGIVIVSVALVRLLDCVIRVPVTVSSRPVDIVVMSKMINVDSDRVVALFDAIDVICAAVVSGMSVGVSDDVSVISVVRSTNIDESDRFSNCVVVAVESSIDIVVPSEIVDVLPVVLSVYSDRFNVVSVSLVVNSDMVSVVLNDVI
jgi:hypothetical protein